MDDKDTGPSGHGLANMLWAVAARLRRRAREREEQLQRRAARDSSA